jgi:hypothetical protein
MQPNLMGGLLITVVLVLSLFAREFFRHGVEKTINCSRGSLFQRLTWFLNRTSCMRSRVRISRSRLSFSS